MPCQVRASASQSCPRSLVATTASVARDEEGDRPPRVRPPADADRVGPRDRRGERGTRRDVEQEGPRELDGGGPPVRPIGAVHSRVGAFRPLRLNWMKPASVKKIDPMKNVRFAPTAPIQSAVPGQRAHEEAHRSDGEAPRLPAQSPHGRDLRAAVSPPHLRRSRATQWWKLGPAPGCGIGASSASR